MGAVNPRVPVTESKGITLLGGPCHASVLFLLDFGVAF